jgi:predicted RND superfamily exporter protein
MGATVIGIALDYGIHVFVAASDAGNARPPSSEPETVPPCSTLSAHLKGDEAGGVSRDSRAATAESIDAAVAEVARPIIFSALTTLGVFWAFFLSSSPGYHQLAFASTWGVALSVWISLTCLPLLFKTGKPKPRRSNPFTAKLADIFTRLRGGGESSTESNAESRTTPHSPPETEFREVRGNAFKRAVTALRRLVVPLWFAILAVSALAALKLDFQTNIRALDGIGEQLRNDEKNFRAIWGESSQAAVSVKAPSFEAALERQDEIAEIAEKAGIPGFQSLSVVWPSLKTRSRNAAAWDAFWTKERIKRLKNDFHKVGAKYSFSENAFAPFFDNLHHHDFSANFADSPGFELFRGKFGRTGGRESRLDAFFNDTPESVAKMRGLTSKIKGASVISPKRFGEYISDAILSDARRVAVFALPLILLLAWICLRNIKEVALAVIPVVTALALEFPAHALSGFELNAIGLVAMIVVTGLAVDYGIFAVSAAKKRDARFAENAVTSLTMSMLSTAIGSGALLFASHPALRTVGLVVTVGVTAAWASAVFAVPAMFHVIRPESAEDSI